MSDFKWRHFQGDIILGCVRWYCKYGISYRDLEEMMLERGIEVDHTTIHRWVIKYAPELEKRLRWYSMPRLGYSLRVDETYIKVKGKWVYLYRAIDKRGHTLDFYLSPTRSKDAAKRFLGKAFRKLKEWEKPHTINTDKTGCYVRAIKELKDEGVCPPDLEHRQVKFLNNLIESDHGKLKRLIKPTLGLVSKPVEPPHQLLLEPYMSLSTHTAPLIQPQGIFQAASEGINLFSNVPPSSTISMRVFFGHEDYDISSSPILQASY